MDFRAASSSGNSSAASARAPLRVLLVEDSAAVAERVSGQIGALEGVKLVATVSGEDAAIRALAKGDVDAVVLDLTLEQGSGFGVLRAVQRLSSHPAIVIFTSYDIPAYRRAAGAFGASEFLNKARDQDKLARFLAGLASAGTA